MAWPHHHPVTRDSEVGHLTSECHQLAQRLADCRIENRQLCEEVARLRRENYHLADRLAHPA